MRQVVIFFTFYFTLRIAPCCAISLCCVFLCARVGLTGASWSRGACVGAGVLDGVLAGWEAVLGGMGAGGVRLWLFGPRLAVGGFVELVVWSAGRREGCPHATIVGRHRHHGCEHHDHPAAGGPTGAVERTVCVTRLLRQCLPMCHLSKAMAHHGALQFSYAPSGCCCMVTQRYVLALSHCKFEF